MEDGKKKWVGKVLRFAVSSALLVAPVAGCGSSEETTHVNEPGTDSPTVNEPPEEPTDGTGGGETPPEEPRHVNEPAPTE